MGDIFIFLLGMVTGMCGAASFLVGIRRREWVPVLVGAALMTAGVWLLN